MEMMGHAEAEDVQIHSGYNPTIIGEHVKTTLLTGWIWIRHIYYRVVISWLFQMFAAV